MRRGFVGGPLGPSPTDSVELAHLTLTSEDLGTTQIDVLNLTNPTAALNGAPQYSPMPVLTGEGWDDRPAVQDTITVEAGWQMQSVQVAGFRPRPKIRLFTRWAGAGAWNPAVDVENDPDNARLILGSAGNNVHIIVGGRLTTDLLGSASLSSSSFVSLEFLGTMRMQSRSSGAAMMAADGTELVESTTLGTNRISALCRGRPLTEVQMPVGSGDRVTYVANAATVPTANPSGGGILYAELGAGKWRGSSGTITTFGPAEPHCPRCGTDFAIACFSNRRYGRMAICSWCLVEALERHGVPASEYTLYREPPA